MGIESEGKNKENKGREEASNKAHNERFSHDSRTVLLLFYVSRNVERIIWYCRWLVRTSARRLAVRRISECVRIANISGIKVLAIIIGAHHKTIIIRI